ncbi:MAG: DUF2934 domain-containing protein [Fimbriiglobus sp.]
MAFTWLTRFTKPRTSGGPTADVPAIPADSTPAVTVAEIPQEKIAQRAYEKWVGRGQQGGSPEQDWLDAVAELRAEYAAARPEPLPNKPR